MSLGRKSMDGLDTAAFIWVLTKRASENLVNRFSADLYPIPPPTSLWRKAGCKTGKYAPVTMQSRTKDLEEAGISIM